ncbi:hypothetical protein GCM10010510_62220 [Streptomyces anandii JCM 4720]|nr:hypothetical protein GCM10010510_62220 [Streptomyces anandii JCM 4720]
MERKGRDVQEVVVDLGSVVVPVAAQPGLPERRAPPSKTDPDQFQIPVMSEALAADPAWVVRPARSSMVRRVS